MVKQWYSCCLSKNCILPLSWLAASKKIRQWRHQANFYPLKMNFCWELFFLMQTDHHGATLPTPTLGQVPQPMQGQHSEPVLGLQVISGLFRSNLKFSTKFVMVLNLCRLLSKFSWSSLVSHLQSTLLVILNQSYNHG